MSILGREHCSVVIPARNEEKTIHNVIREVKKINPYEIIVVVNGSTDQTKKIAASFNCKIIEFSKALGNDLGRAIGAYYAKGKMILFLDADIPISCNQLLPFIEAIGQGHDIALNHLSWILSPKYIPHVTDIAKMAVNQILRRQTLANHSLIAIPHGISQTAIQKIGWWNLADPVLFQAMAIQKNLSLSVPAAIDVIALNKPRQEHRSLSVGSPYPESTSRIMGDHLRAISFLTKQKGERGGLMDGNRQRELLYRYVPPIYRKKAKRSAIIPVSEEKNTISQVIRSVRAAGVDEIIVVPNGADRETIQRAYQEGAIVIPFPQRLGHNIGRAIGAAHSTGDICLFVDGDFVIPPSDLIPFITAVENGIDIVLNDLKSLLFRFSPIDIISCQKYFLNLALKKPNLYNNSLTAVPHAIHRRVIEKIGFKTLMIPPLAQVKAILSGFTIKAVHYVDVIQPNRIRPEHFPKNGIIPAFERIIGDHVEALHYLLSLTNERGGFSDGKRDREFLLQLRSAQRK